MHSQDNKWKQYVVVRKDLGLSMSKMILSCMRVSLRSFTSHESKRHSGDKKERSYEIGHWGQWLDHGSQQKIIFVDSEAELLEIYEQAKNSRVDTYLLRGRPKQDKEDTFLCCTVGPAKLGVLNSIVEPSS